MIHRGQMFEPMLGAVPGFRPAWEAFVREWEGEQGGLPYHLAGAHLAEHLVGLLERSQHDELRQAFVVIERWHVEGDGEVRNIATVGLLENLQNHNLHSTTDPEAFRQFLLPESQRWWNKLMGFWNHGEPLPDDD